MQVIIMKVMLFIRVKTLIHDFLFWPVVAIYMAIRVTETPNQLRRSVALLKNSTSHTNARAGCVKRMMPDIEGLTCGRALVISTNPAT